MEFARVAALRGHTVILYEKNSELGGQIDLASVPSYKYELKSIVPYFKHELPGQRQSFQTYPASAGKTWSSQQTYWPERQRWAKRLRSSAVVK